MSLRRVRCYLFVTQTQAILRRRSDVAAVKRYLLNIYKVIARGFNIPSFLNLDGKCIDVKK